MILKMRSEKPKGEISFILRRNHLPHIFDLFDVIKKRDGQGFSGNFSLHIPNTNFPPKGILL